MLGSNRAIGCVWWGRIHPSIIPTKNLDYTIMMTKSVKTLLKVIFILFLRWCWWYAGWVIKSIWMLMMSKEKEKKAGVFFFSQPWRPLVTRSDAMEVAPSITNDNGWIWTSVLADYFSEGFPAHPFFTGGDN